MGLRIESRIKKGQSAHGDEGDFFVAMVAGGAGGVRVECGSAVHNKEILVVPMRKRDLEEPPTVHSMLHRMRSRVPAIEIAHEMNRFCIRSRAIEINRLEHAAHARFDKRSIHNFTWLPIG